MSRFTYGVDIYDIYAAKRGANTGIKTSSLDAAMATCLEANMNKIVILVVGKRMGRMV